MRKIKLLYIGLFILLLKNSLSGSSIIYYPDLADIILTYLSLTIFAVVIFKERYSFRVLCLYCFFTVVCLYSSFRCGDMLLATSLIVCMAIRKQNFNEIIQFMYKWQKIWLFFHISLSILIWILGGDSIYGYYDSSNRLRFSFGFSHPNTLAIFIFNILLMWVWLKYDNFKKNDYLRYILITLVTYIFTDSRTMLLAAIEFLILLVVVKEVNLLQKLIKVIAMFITPALSILIIILVNLYTSGNTLALIANRLLNSRLLLGAYMVNNYNISLLGQKTVAAVSWDPHWGITNTSFDSTYTSLLISNGYLWLIVLIVAFFLLARKSCSKVHIMIIMWAVYAVTEVHVMNGIKFFPILMLSFLWDKNKIANTQNDHIEKIYNNSTVKELQG